jgi:hypothetical protein
MDHSFAPGRRRLLSLIRPHLYLLLLPLIFASFTAASAENLADYIDGTAALSELDNIRLLPGGNEDPLRFIMGDDHGFLRVFEQRDTGFEEIWVSAYLEGSISGIHIADPNADELNEIVVYTVNGRLHYLDIADYSTIWSNPPNQYEQITCLVIAQIDDDPQLELIFSADDRLIIYDGRDLFEEWRSEQTGITSTDILIADVDGDETDEIVLNDGWVFDSRHRDLEWQASESFGDRMALLDVDGDGIPEIIGEFRKRFLRIYDIDLRREKSPVR